MPETRPSISVVMPVYNGGPFLRAAIDGILGQTLRDLELIIVENGSTDGSREVARMAAGRDPRVRVLEYDRPLGVVGAGNEGAEAARADLIARQDQDDVSLAGRLQAQLAVFRRFPDAVAVGTLWTGIDASGCEVRGFDRWPLARGTPLPPFPHGSACVRRAAFEEVGGYREGSGTWEDVDLFLRLRAIGRVLVVAAPLYRYRFHGASTTSAPRDGQVAGADLMWRCVDEHRRGRDWTALLQQPPATPARGRIAARRAAREADGSALWAGNPPVGAGGGALARARRAWHRASPTTLRLALRSVIRVRDLIAARRVRLGEAVEWRFE